MTDLAFASIAELASRLAARDISPVEITEAALARLEQLELRINAFITVTAESARHAARAAEAAILAGHHLGPLHGIPVAIKDLYATRGVATTFGSPLYADWVPDFDAAAVEQLKRAGAVLLGKTNLHELAYGSTSANAHYGAVHNPWRLDHHPGGSSGGSSAAVAAGVAYGAMGSDTGASIRQPAACTGIVGIKPTFGRLSKFGALPLAWSQDHAGPLTRTVRDCAIMLQHMAGYDARDSTSANVALPDLEAALTGDVRGLRIGIPREYRLEGTPAEILDLWQQGVDWLRSAGCEIREIGLPHTKYALPAYYIVAPAEASSNLARYDGMRYGLRVEGEDLIDTYCKTRRAGFGAEVRRRVMIGTYVLSAGYYDAYYLKAQKVRTLIKRDFEDAFENIDLILTPTTPSPAFRVGERMDDPIQMYLNDVFTVPANLAGLPGISVPAGLTAQGLPLGLQLIGRPFDEATVLRAAAVLESAAAFDAKPSGLAGRA